MLTPLRNQRGQAMAAIGIGMLAFLGIGVLAIDVGHMALTATEVQTAADAGATAGATALMRTLVNGDEDAAVAAAQSDGLSIAQLNPVAGNQPPAGGILIEPGSLDTTVTPPTFTAAAHPLNAVRATVTVSGVPNIIAGIFGQSSHTVTKTATAALTGVQSAPPTLPFALGNCKFELPLDCAHPQTITISVGDGPEPFHTSDTGWATFSGDVPPSSATLMARMPTDCVDPLSGVPGGGVTMDTVTVGQSFDIRESRFLQPTRALESCFSSHPSFIIPFFPCTDDASNSTGHASAVAFGTIVVLGVDTSDPIIPTMDIQLICDSSQSGSLGGTNFGTGSVTMVQ